MKMFSDPSIAFRITQVMEATRSLNGIVGPLIDFTRFDFTIPEHERTGR